MYLNVYHLICALFKFSLHPSWGYAPSQYWLIDFKIYSPSFVRNVTTRRLTICHKKIRQLKNRDLLPASLLVSRPILGWEEWAWLGELGTRKPQTPVPLQAHGQGSLGVGWGGSILLHHKPMEQKPPPPLSLCSLVQLRHAAEWKGRQLSVPSLANGAELPSPGLFSQLKASLGRSEIQ